MGSPWVDIRVVLFTLGDGALCVALNNSDQGVQLPKGVPRPDEALDAAAARVVTEKIGIAERYLEQLYSIAHGDPEDRSVTVAYLGLAISNRSEAPCHGTAWYDVNDLPPLSVLDSRIIEYAQVRLRAKLGYTTIAFHFLPRDFSLTELQGVYETVLGRKIDKRNFRRRMQSGDVLEPTGKSRREGSHRPARLFRFRLSHDSDTYLTPSWAEHSEEETFPS
jgi:8-oxo-dGTP diphosphatase